MEGKDLDLVKIHKLGEIKKCYFEGKLLGIYKERADTISFADSHRAVVAIAPKSLIKGEGEVLYVEKYRERRNLWGQRIVYVIRGKVTYCPYWTKKVEETEGIDYINGYVHTIASSVHYYMSPPENWDGSYQIGRAIVNGETIELRCSKCGKPLPPSSHYVINEGGLCVECERRKHEEKRRNEEETVQGRIKMIAKRYGVSTEEVEKVFEGGSYYLRSPALWEDVKRWMQKCKTWNEFKEVVQFNIEADRIWS